MKFVSCICPTYNRAPHFLHLLEEAVSSFARQDWPLEARELIIVNDTPGQTLVCDTPGVKIVNLPKRFDSLGEKYNFAINYSMGDVILPWEDDDISLPFRIRHSVSTLGSFDYFNPQQSWYLEGESLIHTHTHGVCHNASAFTRDAWRIVGGYPHISGAQDAGMDHALRGLRVHPRKFKSPEEWSYIYRWGSSNCHLSGTGNHEEFYREVGKWPIVQGEFRIVPAWKQDYATRCKILAEVIAGKTPKCPTC